MGLRSSAELQLTGTKVVKVKKEIDRVADQIRHKEQQNQAAKEVIDTLREEYKKQGNEIIYKDGVIA